MIGSGHAGRQQGATVPEGSSPTMDSRLEGAREPLVRLVSVTRDYGQGRGVFDASLEVQSGQVVALIGANGSGKTTLFRCATLFEPIDSGEVVLGGYSYSTSKKRDGGSIARSKLELLRGRVVGTVFQDSRPWPHLDVRNNVLLPLTQGLRLAPVEAAARADGALERLGLLDRAAAMPWQLSGGLQQRLVLARTLALEPSILFVDEGTSALDPSWTEHVRQLLRGYADSNGCAVVVISHQMGFVRRLADRVLFLHQGRIVEDGPPESVFGSPNAKEFEEFLANA
jgi:ABC-type polar amino acid transport system ATPase subunit